MQRLTCCKVARLLPLTQKRSHRGSATGVCDCISIATWFSGRTDFLEPDKGNRLKTCFNFIAVFLKKSVVTAKPPLVRSEAVAYLTSPSA